MEKMEKMEKTGKTGKVNKNLKKIKKRNKNGKKLILFILILVFILASYFAIKVTDDMGIFKEDIVTSVYPGTSTYGFAFKNSYYYSTADGLKSVNVNGKEHNIDQTQLISTFVRGMNEPIFLKSDKTSLVYDISGKTAVLFNENKMIQTFNFDREIITAKMTKNGRFVFVINDSGAKAVVRAYDESGFELFCWFSGVGYVADAALSNQKDTMAVITNEVENGAITSKIFFFDLKQSEPFLQKTISDKICSYLSYSKDGCLMICDNGLYYISDMGLIEQAMDFSGKNVKEFKSFTNGDIIVCYEGQDNSKYTAEVFNTKGRRTKKFTISAFDKISDISDDKFLVIRRKEAVSFSKNGRVLKTIPSDFEIRTTSYFRNRVSILGNDSLVIK